jgi:uncharacterized membrane protein YccC
VLLLLAMLVAMLLRTLLLMAAGAARPELDAPLRPRLARCVGCGCGASGCLSACAR